MQPSFKTLIQSELVRLEALQRAPHPVSFVREQSRRFNALLGRTPRLFSPLYVLRFFL